MVFLPGRVAYNQCELFPNFLWSSSLKYHFTHKCWILFYIHITNLFHFGFHCWFIVTKRRLNDTTLVNKIWFRAGIHAPETSLRRCSPHSSRVNPAKPTDILIDDRYEHFISRSYLLYCFSWNSEHQYWDNSRTSLCIQVQFLTCLLQARFYEFLISTMRGRFYFKCKYLFRFISDSNTSHFTTGGCE